MKYFITGGSRGIGAGLVLDAVKLGHDVAFTYNHNEEKAHQVAEQAKAIRPEAQVRPYRLDVRNSDDVEAVVDRVAEDFETIEVVVNNAGINRDSMLVFMDNEAWDEVIATNLTGPFYVARQVLPLMTRNRFGRIINISSLIYCGGSGQANYAASKAGLHGLTQTIAKEYGKKGITANAVVPGFFDTDMTRETMAEDFAAFWKTYCPVPKGRMGKLSEMSALVNFLASEGGGFVNGQIINITGGLDWGP